MSTLFVRIAAKSHLRSRWREQPRSRNRLLSEIAVMSSRLRCRNADRGEGARKPGGGRVYRAGRAREGQAVR
jgi:hypothetical protein